MVSPSVSASPIPSLPMPAAVPPLYPLSPPTPPTPLYTKAFGGIAICLVIVCALSIYSVSSTSWLQVSLKFSGTQNSLNGGCGLWACCVAGCSPWPVHCVFQDARDATVVIRGLIIAYLVLTFCAFVAGALTVVFRAVGPSRATSVFCLAALVLSVVAIAEAEALRPPSPSCGDNTVTSLCAGIMLATSDQTKSRFSEAVCQLGGSWLCAALVPPLLAIALGLSVCYLAPPHRRKNVVVVVPRPTVVQQPPAYYPPQPLPQQPLPAQPPLALPPSKPPQEPVALTSDGYPVFTPVEQLPPQPPTTAHDPYPIDPHADLSGVFLGDPEWAPDYPPHHHHHHHHPHPPHAHFHPPFLRPPPWEGGDGVAFWPPPSRYARGHSPRGVTLSASPRRVGRRLPAPSSGEFDHGGVSLSPALSPSPLALPPPQIEPMFVHAPTPVVG